MVQCKDYLQMTSELIEAMKAESFFADADTLQRALDESTLGTELAMKIRFSLEGFTSGRPDVSAKLRQQANDILLEVRRALPQ